jgi:hypothetical protein
MSSRKLPLHMCAGAVGATLTASCDRKIHSPMGNLGTIPGCQPQTILAGCQIHFALRVPDHCRIRALPVSASALEHGPIDGRGATAVLGACHFSADAGRPCVRPSPRQPAVNSASRNGLLPCRMGFRPGHGCTRGGMRFRGSSSRCPYGAHLGIPGALGARGLRGCLLDGPAGRGVGAAPRRHSENLIQRSQERWRGPTVRVRS